MLKIKEMFLTIICVLLAITVTAGYFAQTQAPIYRPVLFFKQEYVSTSSGGVAMAVPFTGMTEAVAAAAVATASGQGTNTSSNSPNITATPSIIPSFLVPLPPSFEINKQWDGEYRWFTTGVTFWTNLEKGEVIQFGYNSSAPVAMELGSGMEQIAITWKTGSSHNGSYKVTQEGLYYFDFFIQDSVHKSEDVTISFKCYEAANRAAVNMLLFGE